MNKFCFAVMMVISLGIFTKYAWSQGVGEYELGPGDLVSISVFGQEDLSVETRLSNAGTINYPFLGDIELIGLSVSEVERLIDTGLRGDYLINPSISVKVVEYRPFFIDGEVNKPGGYPYQPGLSVSKAAALAGGYTERASKQNIIVVRLVAGQEISIEITEKDFVLPGDVVTVQQRFF